MPDIKIEEKTVDSKVLIEYCYGIIKNLSTQGAFKSEDVEAIAELTTELANRLKVEEACGKQESQECP